MTFRKEADCADWKFPDWSRKTFSRSFDSGDPESWKNALRSVHDHCWKKWKLASKEPAFQLKKVRRPKFQGKFQRVSSRICRSGLTICQIRRRDRRKWQALEKMAAKCWLGWGELPVIDQLVFFVECFGVNLNVLECSGTICDFLECTQCLVRCPIMRAPEPTNENQDQLEACKKYIENMPLKEFELIVEGTSEKPVVKYKCFICTTKGQPDGKLNHLGKPSLNSLKRYLHVHSQSYLHVQNRAIRASQNEDDHEVDKPEPSTCNGHLVFDFSSL